MSHRTPAVRRAEKTLTRKLASGLEVIGREVARKVSAVAKAEGDDTIDETLEGLDWAPIAATLKTQLTLVAQDGSKRALAVLGIEDEGITDHTFDEAVSWASARSAELVGKSWDEDGNLVDNPDADMAITDTIREEIRAAVADALEQGIPSRELAANLQDLAGFSAARALLIARTETVRANSAGQLQAFRNSGVVQKKGWSTSNEIDVCDDCQHNEDAGDIDIDEDFPSGDDAPGAHPGCRCVLVASVTSGEGESEDQGEDEEQDEGEQAAEE